MKPDIKDILAEARRLKDERFNRRNDELERRRKLRFREQMPEVPVQYKNTATVYQTPLIQEEGRQLDAILNAKPQVKVLPRPTSLSICKCAPCRLSTCLTMDRPRPVPPDSRERLVDTR